MINVGAILLNSAAAALTLGIFLIILNYNRINRLNMLILCTRASALLVVGSFVVLIYSFYASDFSLLIVYKYSHELKPLLYKITGVWANHEGSFLLFISILSIVNYIVSHNKNLNKSGIIYKSLLVNIIITNILVFYSIFTSNPFEALFPVPTGGMGLNPLLQDVGLAFHPPTLYIGYVCLSVVFSASVAALWVRKMPKEWAPFARNWAIAALIFLTAGIGLGSWWAYRELGWGGFWFWDPVENTSLLPWLCTLALLHALVAFDKRSILTRWVLLLGILSFSLALTGFFLVRSGVLTSVHTFASDPTRGIFLMMIIALVVGGGLMLYGIKSHHFHDRARYRLISREGMILINNLMVMVLCVTVLFATVYPLLLQVFAKQSVAVGAPYFNTVFNPLAVILLVIAAIAPAVQWKSGSMQALLKRETVAAALSGGVLMFTLEVTDYNHLLASCAIAGATWLFCAVARMVWERYRQYRGQRRQSLARFMTPSFCGMVLSHAAFALLVFSVALFSIGNIEIETSMKKGGTLEVGDYDLLLKNVEAGMHENYFYERAEVLLGKNGKIIKTLYPERRLFQVEKTMTTESAVYYGLLGDVYVVIGEEHSDGGRAVRAYFRPMVSAIWLSCCMIVAGLVCSFYGYRTGKRK